MRPASDIDDRALADAVRKIGMGFNPDTLETNIVYLQVIRPGVVQFPHFERLGSTGVPPDVRMGRRFNPAA